MITKTRRKQKPTPDQFAIPSRGRPLYRVGDGGIDSSKRSLVSGIREKLDGTAPYGGWKWRVRWENWKHTGRMRDISKAFAFVNKIKLKTTWKVAPQRGKAQRIPTIPAKPPVGPPESTTLNSFPPENEKLAEPFHFYSCFAPKIDC